MPPSACFNTAVICSTEKRFLFTARLLGLVGRMCRTLTLDVDRKTRSRSRVPARYERLVTKQARAARTSKSDLVARYVIEKSLETEFPGISFRDSPSGREAYLTGHRVAVWEVVTVHDETKSADKTARHFG